VKDSLLSRIRYPAGYRIIHIRFYPVSGKFAIRYIPYQRSRRSDHRFPTTARYVHVFSLSLFHSIPVADYQSVATNTEPPSAGTAQTTADAAVGQLQSQVCWPSARPATASVACESATRSRLIACQPPKLPTIVGRRLITLSR
jgi:hypothetical protein